MPVTELSGGNTVVKKQTNKNYDFYVHEPHILAERST